MLQFTVTAIAACVLLSACGGFLQEEAAPVAQDCVVGGVVQDIQSQPLEGVSVAVQLDRLYEATTDASGRYEFVIPPASAYLAQFAGTATMDTYLPKPVVFKRTGACPAALEQPLVMRQLVASDILFPQGIAVTHLGDDVFAGEVNSQLQVSASGLQWSDGFTYTGEMQAQYTRLCVSFQARGVQSSLKEDTISLSRNGDGQVVESLRMSDTDSSGDYTEASYCFSLAPFTAGERIDVTIASGNGGLPDYDDFEFVSVVGSLLP
jgi:hypothetical protein